MISIMTTAKILTSRKSFRSLLLLFVYCLLVTLVSLFIFLSHNNNNNNKNKNNSSNSQSSATNRRLNDINNNYNNKHGVSINNNNINNRNNKYNLEQTSFKMHTETPTNANEIFHDESRDYSSHPSFNPTNNNVQRHSTTSHNHHHHRHHHQQQQQQKQQNIPRTVHIVWFYPNSTVFRFHQALSLLSVQKFLRPSKIFFWHDSLPTGTWWLFACQSIAHLLFVPLERPRQVFNWSVSVPEHQSDVARIQLLRKYGGLYVDLDVILLRDLDPLFQYEVTMGAETPDILGSGFIMARPNATFLELWLDSYRTDFDDSDWNRHSTKVPMELARRHPGLIHVEWFTINRPNWFERKWLYEVGRLWDWSGNYAVHLWYREHNVEYSPQSIRRLNTTVAEIFRFIYYQSPKLLEDWCLASSFFFFQSLLISCVCDNRTPSTCASGWIDECRIKRNCYKLR